MRRVLALVAILVCVAVPRGAKAADLVFSVVDGRGRPVPDAVVTAYPEGPHLPAIRFPWAPVMGQHNLQFDPFVLIVPVGADVSFPNHDSVRHHVYSFSPAKPFELKLYGKDETRSVRFDRAGVVALGCNIHDGMVAFIKVVDTPYAAKTDAAGQATLHGVPSGPVQVHVWHPYQKAANNETVRLIRAGGAESEHQAVQIDVRAAPDPGAEPTEVFRNLRTKLTVLYAGLFGAALLVISLMVYVSIAANARTAVRGELMSAGTVFDRVWALRASQLEGGASLLSRDFGFREAVASRDEATIQSALENLRVRLGIDVAFIVGVDGRVSGGDAAELKGAAGQIMAAVEQEDNPSGVLVIKGAPYQTIAAPILSPTLVGWVVFASRLDAKEMRSLERLSAIPLDAAVFARDARSGAWAAPAAADEGVYGKATPAQMAKVIDTAMAMKTPEPSDVRFGSGNALTLVKPLKSLGGQAPAALVLSYPLARAMAPYSPMLAMIVLTGVGGIALLVIGSWMLAKSVTRPISALDQAAQSLQRGENDLVEVEVTTHDEMGRLAESFNAMASEIRERERRIIHIAMHDAETGLPSRLALDQAVEAMAPTVAAEGLKLAVLSLSVDRFAHVRGAIGYGLAGELMTELGQILQRLRPSNPIGRVAQGVLGLAIVVEDVDEARRIAADLQGAMEAPLRLGDNTIDVSLTLGIALYPDLVDAPDALINKSSVAVDQARATHRKIAVFDAAAYGDPQAKLGLMSEMLEAIADGGMFIHLQPKFDLRLARTTGAEALVRWRHQARGMIPPDDFIPMAEETGHIGALTLHVLALAIAQQSSLKEAGFELAMSVNLSGRLVGDPEFAGDLLRLAATARGELCFEITETAVISNPEVALQNIERFSAAGVRISIDDYGSGLSSLAYLKRIKAHELKIDKAFVIGMAEGPTDALLVRSTVDLAHSLGMKVTAEGVETAMAQVLLTGMGCDLAQGYHIARPMVLGDLIVHLGRERKAPARQPKTERLPPARAGGA